ncbi:unnamed protein product [Adineta steineri]|uniref:G-protein coupled receptors family 1 profile domain-containing protein n=1 Tax=Adineta steineri TaxID=433720 RepID=A0A813UVB5_9BILA|nr:unnamed protein product [Adineta steineri]CAF3645519.1 unnamed protein product [Adineta steineri]
MQLENESIIINIESWFIPIDILLILSTGLSILFGIIFLLIIIYDKTCHTVSIMLIGNSCLTEIIYGINMFSMGLFTFENDLKQIQYQDSLCLFRGYFGYVVTSLQNYSYLSQAMYRYIIIIYPTRRYYQTIKFQFILICLTWIFSLLCPIPYILLNEIKYNVYNQICQMPLHLSFITIYNAFCIYLIPLSLLILIYLKLIKYVRKMNKNIILVNNLIRAQSELKMVRRIIILVTGVIIIGFPYTMFFFLSFFINLPKYHFRIAYIFVDISLLFVIIILFQFTDQIKIFIRRKIIRRTNIVLPIIT